MKGAPSSLRDLFIAIEDLLTVENISQTSGFLQGINSSIRLLAFFIIIFSSLFVSSPIQLMLLYAPVPFLAIASNVPLEGFIKRNLLIPLPAVIAGVPAVFMMEGNTLLETHLGSLTVSVSEEALIRLVLFSLRIWVSYGCLSLLVQVSGIDGVLATLTTMRVPPLLVTLISLTYRYIHLSVHECVKVLLAIEARTIRHSRRITLSSLRNLADVISILFLRSINRGERVYLAMKARGFSLNTNIQTSFKIRGSDLFFLLLSVIYSAMIISGASWI